MEAMTTFRCERYRCVLSPAACISRQLARRQGGRCQHGRGEDSALYPRCQDCDQGKAVRAVHPEGPVEPVVVDTAPPLPAHRRRGLPAPVEPEAPTAAPTPPEPPAPPPQPQETTVSKLCTRCQKHPIDATTDATPSGTEEWCRHCRRLESARRAGHPVGGAGATAAKAAKARVGEPLCACGKPRGEVRSNTPEAHRELCPACRKHERSVALGKRRMEREKAAKAQRRPVRSTRAQAPAPRQPATPTLDSVLEHARRCVATVERLGGVERAEELAAWLEAGRAA